LGRRSLPKVFFFLVVFAGFAGKHHQKKGFLGGLAALQTSLRGRLRNLCHLGMLQKQPVPGVGLQPAKPAAQALPA
jgi:hypothetical protein